MMLIPMPQETLSARTLNFDVAVCAGGETVFPDSKVRPSGDNTSMFSGECKHSRFLLPKVVECEAALQTPLVSKLL
jgi:hypothetical protein